MIFAKTFEAVLTEQKFQTRRVVQDKDTISGKGKNKKVKSGKRIKWQVGRDYAVQAGRGMPTLWWSRRERDGAVLVAEEEKEGYIEARIEITDIRREDVREISAADVIAEGFRSHTGFYQTWCEMHDVTAYRQIKGMTVYEFDKVRRVLSDRPDEHYDAWVIEFKLVGGERDE